MNSVNKTYFVQIIQEHQGIINSICHVYYADDEDVKDARQDIILQLWKSLPTFRGESKISTWIYRVALNTILFKIKKDRKNTLNDSLSDIHLNTGFNTDYPPNDDVEQLLFLINQLEATDKAVIILHFEGYNHKEIAETLNMTTTNISTRMNRIKNKLKETLKAVYHEIRSI